MRGFRCGRYALRAGIGQKTKTNQALIAVVLPFVLAGHCEVVSNCIAFNEVKLEGDTHTVIVVLPGDLQGRPR